MSNTINSFEILPKCVPRGLRNFCPVAVVAVGVTLLFQKNPKRPESSLIKNYSSLFHL